MCNDTQVTSGECNLQRKYCGFITEVLLRRGIRAALVETITESGTFRGKATETLRPLDHKQLLLLGSNPLPCLTSANRRWKAQNSDRSNCPSFLQKDNLAEHAGGNGAARQSGSGIFVEQYHRPQLKIRSEKSKLKVNLRFKRTEWCPFLKPQCATIKGVPIMELLNADLLTAVIL